MTAPDTNPRSTSTGAEPQRGMAAWSPPASPADTAGKRRADLLVRYPAALHFAVVIVLLTVSPLLPVRGELLLVTAAALIGGTACGLNFWRCRHAHCLITGVGWLALAAFTAVEAGLGHSLVAGTEQLVFLGILVLALAFEGAWYLARGTNALGRGSD